MTVNGLETLNQNYSISRLQKLIFNNGLFTTWIKVRDNGSQPKKYLIPKWLIEDDDQNVTFF